MNSITRRGKPWRRLLSVAFWILVWFAAAELIGQEILLASPVKVITRFCELIVTVDFRARVLNSFAGIMAGLALGAISGILLGCAAFRYNIIRELFAPFIGMLRAVPVASFIVLALVWVSKGGLSTLISLIICLPVFYTDTLEGLASADKRLVEMADVFRLSAIKRVRAIYLPVLLPGIRSAFAVSVGLAWKSGVAAELIAVPKGTIGEMLYSAKVYLETADMLCWTITVVLLSALTGRLIAFVLERAEKRYG